ncbi:low molecular weight protein-tyrosine-phosphatase [Agrococcus casei]|uniref:protein-tyrosine-phosphatase n=1 Tax=Agrococcus casei LMG 22410 TaxID=1255656 RepID=A0A1R4ER62_9MICO|nr:low molecular weight protein-tyrosine-phosphatase [Agrococcus casei]SJM46184.1 Low molecular weight protein tyrosine phosphatase [Agrococcus casei LMG 22410]
MTLERQLAESDAFRIAFVCTGNICRSPMAEAVLRARAEKKGVSDRLIVASGGIGDYHVGEPADPRTLRALAGIGLNAEGHRAKRFQRDWFDLFDLVIALDRGQERVLLTMATPEQKSKIKLLMSFEHDAETLDVPDPYYSDEEFFVDVLHQIESASRRLFKQIKPALRAPTPANGSNTQEQA